MKVSDIIVVIFMYAVCLFFYVLIQDLPEEAQTYPLSIVVALCVLTTIFLVRRLAVLFKEGFGNDITVLFTGFKPGQFVCILLFCTAYIILLPTLGFYGTSVLFLLGCMLFLRVPKLQILVTVFALGVLIYLVFTLFLKVPMPVGTLFQ